MGLREVRKQTTRARVLEAARVTFDEVGYEPAAIRDIAKRAGVSVGSVFTTFGGKADLLAAVMADRLDSLYAELDRLIPHLRGGTLDRLRSIMAVHYGFEAGRLRLFVAYVCASYGYAAERGGAPFGGDPRLRQILADVLVQGIERGEVRPDADLEGCVDAIVAAYMWNHQRACEPAISADDLIGLMDRQIGVLFNGVCAR